MNDAGDRIRAALAEQPYKMSVADLARQAGINAVTARAYANGERNPPLDKCLAMGVVLGVRGQWLFDGRGSRHKPPSKADGPAFIQVPLLDMVAAGKLAAPGSQIPIEDVPLLAFADLGRGEFFALTVKGSSMDRVSPDGAVIIANRLDKTLVSGRCYVFGHRGETTYKRWQGGEPSYLEPYSTDAVHKPLFVRRNRDLEVIGRVVRSVLEL